jgi:3-dehydroquinate dehydratase / shikimate dehydrogenase
MTCQLVGTLMPRVMETAAQALLHPPAGVDTIELRLDALPEPDERSVQALLALPRSAPVIVACRASAALSDEARLALLACAARAGADTLDVEDALLARLPADLPGERLPSCHLARFAPRLDALARRLVGHGAGLAKLAVPAETPRHLAALLELQEQFAGRVAIVPTGRLSEAARVLIAGRGAPLAYGALSAEHLGHPDQPTVARLHAVFGIGHVGPATRFAAVVARPVRHSLSPAYHNTIFTLTGQDRRLVAIEVDRLGELLEVADALRLDGFAVSQPFKQEAYELAASRMPGAEAAGAANTLLRTPAGWQARNTDWRAACEILPRLLKGWRKRHAGARPRVLLLGSGGAARAIAVALFTEEVELGVWSRRPEQAQRLVKALTDAMPGVHAVPEPLVYAADLVVNATPVGSPLADAQGLPALERCFSPGALAVDLTYGTHTSPFREAATQAGAQMTSGEEFFFRQARRQAEIFTGGTVPDALHQGAVARATPD